MTYYSGPSPAPWTVTVVPVLIAAALLAPLLFLRRMSVLTRTGVLLLSLAPAYLISLWVLFTCFPAVNPCPSWNYPGHFEMDVFAISPGCHWLSVIWNIFFDVFFLAIGLLCLAGIAWLVRLRRRSA